jgi:hypothetical protein
MASETEEGRLETITSHMRVAKVRFESERARRR